MRVIGMMSGTSADGIDVALVRVIGRPPNLRARLERSACFPYPPPARREILRIASGATASAGEIAKLNVLVGELFARAALDACRKFRVSPRSVQLIGSHGQTIFHQGQPAPYLGARAIAATMQIGEPAAIAARTGIPTVGDFRPADLAAGGQGAPLVPFVDYLLYYHPRRGRVALNIGGIANLTAIPAAARPQDVFAFDTGPGNMVVDSLVARATGGRLRYDRGARLARRGRIVPALLAELLADPFFRENPPKSAGREQFGSEFADRALRWARRNRVRFEDVLYTVTVLTAVTIAKAVRKWVAPKMHVDDLIVSGGGAHNPLLMERLRAGFTGIAIVPSGRFGVPEDAKEAFAFAVLAYETFHGRPSNLPRATGASRPAVLGKLCRP
ncbi:MAG TPA: anhydro-N-acetylmuramic acid kinase [Candidatus Acidoferrales bacterium]|nr:anhydro-N-acetylmuramic acid kinase [Candidatus Acidoferrales bacterium]